MTIVQTLSQKGISESFPARPARGGVGKRQFAIERLKLHFIGAKREVRGVGKRQFAIERVESILFVENLF